MTVEQDMQKTFHDLALEVAASNTEVAAWMRWIALTTNSEGYKDSFATAESAEGTFRDILSVYARPENNEAIKDYDIVALTFILSHLFMERTNKGVQNAFIPALVTTLAIRAEEDYAGAKEFHKSDLARLMDITNRARMAGWSSQESKDAITRFMRISAEYFATPSAEKAVKPTSIPGTSAPGRQGPGH